MTAIRITVTKTAGSVPREAGAQMLVWPDRTQGTIGGGTLEWQAMAEARRMLQEGRKTHSAR
ncbi:MAG: XdhC family protein, partial [Pseudomonadota bacterium]